VAGVLSPARSCNEYYNSEKTQGPPAFSGFPASARTTGHRLPTAACRLYLAFLTCPVTARLTTGLSVPMGRRYLSGCYGRRVPRKPQSRPWRPALRSGWCVSWTRRFAGLWRCSHIRTCTPFFIGPHWYG